MKIFYSHHLWKYGTKIEAWELGLIKAKFPGAEIINPNGDVKQDQPEDVIMADCLRLVKECDVLVFSSLDGIIGKGVFRELNAALESRKPVYYLHAGEIGGAGQFMGEIRNNATDRLYADVWATDDHRRD